MQSMVRGSNERRPQPRKLLTLVHSGEQFLHDGDVCNLGSINLEGFHKDGQVDVNALKAVTRTAVRMLDNVIDISKFPVEKVNQTFRANRRLGLGIMGYVKSNAKME